MAKGSDNPFPSILVVEGTTPASPASGDQRVFIDSSDHKLKRVNSSGTVTTVEGGTGGSLGSTRAFASGTSASIARDAAWHATAFNSEDFDDLSVHDNVTNNTRFTVAVTGRYRFTAQLAFTALVSGSQNLVGVYKNSQATGTRLSLVEWTQSAATEHVRQVESGIVQLTAGDYVEVYANLGGGGSTTVIAATTSDVTWGVLERIS